MVFLTDGAEIVSCNSRAEDGDGVWDSGECGEGHVFLVNEGTTGDHL